MSRINAATLFLDLASGPRVAYEEYGDPGGAPIFFCHGWPASRLQGAGCGYVARELGLRIISPDRPGIGRSSFQSGRRLLDWPPLLREMADHLGIERFRILAISGGGPYAFAAAWALPERVEVIAVASGAPPLPAGTDLASLLAVYRWMLRAYRWQPGALRWLFRCARPFATVRPARWLESWILKLVPPADAKALRAADVFRGSYECYRESWRDSGLGVATDAEIYANAWGFALEEIRVPVRLWHGREDRSFHWKLAAALAEKLPDCATFFVEGEGHYSLPIRRYGEILRDLRDAAPRKA